MCRTARLFLFYQPRTEGGFTRLQQTYSKVTARGITLLEHMKTAAHDHLQTSLRRRLARQARAFTAFAALAVCFLLAPQWIRAQAASSTGQLRIYSIDVEGGQSTLLVAPSGESLLVDTGWPGNDGRDAERILAAMRDAGIKRIDHVLITHFHDDHVGGVPELVARVEVGEFLDHGENREEAADTRNNYAIYVKAIAGHNRRIVHPGDTIPIDGLNVVVLTADGEHIAAVPGIKPVPNPYCASEHAWPDDPTENARSAGILVTFGKFKFLDLGDLTGKKEVALVCPNNPIGTIDLYLVTHHGMDLSNSRAIVDAVHPRVAIMNNGAHKAGMPAAWQIVHDSPGLIDLWQLHTAEGSDAAHNSPEALIANPKGDGDGHALKVVALPNGSFSVTNTRTGMTKQYPRK
ncbi:MAG: MBL fold metallo-hydrolase [Terracidiphilus sp.]